MALVGRIGTTGASFLVGTSTQFTAAASGELFLAPNDEWYLVWGNAGSLTVSICVGASGGASAPAAWRPGRPILPSPALVIVASGLLALLAFAMGIRRRRRVVGAAVVLGLLVPAAALAQTTTQVIEYYTTDALGSVRAVTKKVNGTWQVVSRHDYMPFGEEVSPPPPPSDKRLFTGKERDSETGQDCFEARYLRAGIGRFTTVDPVVAQDQALADPQRWNRYTYVANNPLKYTDPDGRDIRYATPALREQLFRLAWYAPGLAAEIVAAVKDPTLLVDIVEKDFRNTCPNGAPGCDSVNAEDGVKIVTMIINPDDDRTARHEWGHEKDVRTNWAQFWKDTHDRGERAKEHESAHERRAEAQKKAWEQQHKIIASPKEWQKFIQRISFVPVVPVLVP
jgi:RHS repeat-associated protein